MQVSEGFDGCAHTDVPTSHHTFLPAMTQVPTMLSATVFLPTDFPNTIVAGLQSDPAKVSAHQSFGSALLKASLGAGNVRNICSASIV